MKRNLFIVAAVTFVLAALVGHAHAQTAPLPPGNVILGTFDPGNCPGGTNAGWVPTASCARGTVTCNISLGVAQLGFVLGYATPSGANKGTVVALTGGAGTTPATAEGGEVQALELAGVAVLSAGHVGRQLGCKCGVELPRQ